MTLQVEIVTKLITDLSDSRYAIHLWCRVLEDAYHMINDLLWVLVTTSKVRVLDCSCCAY